MSRQMIGFLLVTPGGSDLVLSEDANPTQMFNASTVDVERYRNALEATLAAEEELLEGIEPELDDLISETVAARNRAAYNRQQRAKQLKARLNFLRGRHDTI